jgi:hypothetical protein
MRNSGVALLFGIALLLTFAACQNRPFQTVAIYDDPSRFVRLEVDPVIGGSHSHPIDITTDDMSAVLAGVMIEEQPGFMAPSSLLLKDKEPRQHPAFSETEVHLFAPLLAKGLQTAKPEEVVTFGQTNQITATSSKVTSGGVFVEGDELHLLLSNYRSETNYAPDPGISGTILDARSSPLRSIAPQQTRLYFEPNSAVAASNEGMLSHLLRPDRREIVILFKKLPSRTSDMGHKPD